MHFASFSPSDVCPAANLEDLHVQRSSLRLGLFLISFCSDWFEDLRKFPNGLAGLAKDVNDIGLKFGIWVSFLPSIIEFRVHDSTCSHMCVSAARSSLNAAAVVSWM